jgi:hypothetical protein
MCRVQISAWNPDWRWSNALLVGYEKLNKPFSAYGSLPKPAFNGCTDSSLFPRVILVDMISLTNVGGEWSTYDDDWIIAVFTYFNVVEKAWRRQPVPPPPF